MGGCLMSQYRSVIAYCIVHSALSTGGRNGYLHCQHQLSGTQGIFTVFGLSKFCMGNNPLFVMRIEWKRSFFFPFLFFFGPIQFHQLIQIGPLPRRLGIDMQRCNPLSVPSPKRLPVDVVKKCQQGRAGRFVARQIKRRTGNRLGGPGSCPGGCYPGRVGK